MQECDYIQEKDYQQKYEQIMSKALGNQASLFKVPKIYP